MGMAPLALIHIYVGGTVWEALEGVALLEKRVTEGGPTPFLVSPPFSIFWLVSCGVSSWLLPQCRAGLPASMLPAMKTMTSETASMPQLNASFL